MQTLRRNWLVVWKMTWGISWIFESFKICTLMGSFWPKYIILELKKVQWSYASLYWRSIQTLKEKWLVFINNMRNLVKFTGTFKNLKICTLRDFLVQGIQCVSWKITEELCVMILKGDVIFKEKLTGDLKNDIKNLVNFHASSCK